MKTHRILPTTRTHFQKGKRVAWDWNMQKKWPTAWYRDPNTGGVKRAWIKSAEFIGRHLDDIDSQLTILMVVIQCRIKPNMEPASGLSNTLVFERQTQ